MRILQLNYIQSHAIMAAALEAALEIGAEIVYIQEPYIERRDNQPSEIGYQVEYCWGAERSASDIGSAERNKTDGGVQD